MNINRTSIPDQVMNELLQVIAAGEVKPGEKLPSEHELCELFGVSRPSVKTAIDRLNLLGIVEQKVGDGTYVKDTSASDLLSVYAKYFINFQEIPQLLDLARTLEQESLRCLAANPDSGRLGTLTRRAAAINQAAPSEDSAALYDNVLAFHNTLCGFHANPYVIQIHRMLRPALLMALTGHSTETPAAVTGHSTGTPAAITGHSTGTPAAITGHSTGTPAAITGSGEQTATGSSAAQAMATDTAAQTAPIDIPIVCYSRICQALQQQQAETAVNELNTIFQAFITHFNHSGGNP